MIRQPRHDEFEAVSCLIYQSGPEVFDYFFASKEERVLRYLHLLFNKPDTAFFREFILVDEEKGAIRGAILGLPGRDKHRLEKNIGRYGRELIRLSGFFTAATMLVHGRLARFFDVINTDEYYIGNLAVSREHRGRHVGPALLETISEVAAAAGYTKLSLLVEQNNEHAKHVYQKFGFVTEQRIVLPGKFAKHGLYGFHKLVHCMPSGQGLIDGEG